MINQENKKFYIYVIQHMPSLRVYVGQTNKQKPHIRWLEHKWDTNKILRGKNVKYPLYIHKSIAKYGIDQFTFQVIEETNTQERVDELEAEWIEFFRSNIRGYGFNIAPGGKNIGFKKTFFNQGSNQPKERKKSNRRPTEEEKAHLGKIHKPENVTEDIVREIRKRYHDEKIEYLMNEFQLTKPTVRAIGNGKGYKWVK